MAGYREKKAANQIFFSVFLILATSRQQTMLEFIQIRSSLWGHNISSDVRSFLKCILNSQLKDWTLCKYTDQPIDVVHFDTLLFFYFNSLSWAKLQSKYNLLLSFAFTFLFGIQRPISWNNKIAYLRSPFSFQHGVSEEEKWWCKIVMRFNSFIPGS